VLRLRVGLGFRVRVVRWTGIANPSIFARVIEKIKGARFLWPTVYNSIDDGKLCAGIYLDLQKAFDMVNHDILLYKLYNYGIRGVVHDWFRNYLSNRQQYTCVNGINSSLTSLSCGVPQGSVLGPLLFLIYVNDIGNVGLKVPVRLFADDTNLFIFGKNYLILMWRISQLIP